MIIIMVIIIIVITKMMTKETEERIIEDSELSLFNSLVGQQT